MNTTTMKKKEEKENLFGRFDEVLDKVLGIRKEEEENFESLLVDSSNEYSQPKK